MASNSPHDVTRNADANWPPRSPHEVLLSTPGGRDRIRHLAQRASPSPSPVKRSTSMPAFQDVARERLKQDQDRMDIAEDDDDDDEEMLELQLQEIQARLKLKKLQKKTKHGSDTESDVNQSASATLLRANSAAAYRTQSRASGLREEYLRRPTSQTSVNVPASPVRRVQPTAHARSPARVLLGIDRGLEGSDVSLRRAPSLKKSQEMGLQDKNRIGPFLQRAGSQAGSRTAGVIPSSHSLTKGDGPKTFSERIAAVRAKDTDRLEREIRIKKNRSMAFDIDHQQMQNFKDVAVALVETPRAAPDFSREEVINSYKNPSGNSAHSTRTSSLRSVMRGSSNVTETTDAKSIGTISQTPLENPPLRKINKSKARPAEIPESEASQFEPYSSIHLSKRIIPHQVLTRLLTGKKTFVIKDLLRIVKAPDFLGPDIEEDVVLFAIIASKSEPRSHQSKSMNENRGKYMVMALTDLKWELDLYLFDSAFERFWKLTVGTIIAILNPSFMPPSRGKVDTGKFSLTLNSNADTILEVGSARDLGFCKSVKKDGKICDSWVDKRHTEFCDFHVNETLKRTHAARMEVNTMTFGKGHNGERKFQSRDMTGVLERRREADMEQKTRYDRESHSQIFIGRSVKLLDGADFDPDASNRGSTKEERMTRLLVAQEKERNLVEKLSQIGGGLGADYLRRIGSTKPDLSCNNAAVAQPPLGAAALGLLGGKAKDVNLSPIKRKRANTVSSTAAMGWGGNLTKELGRMKNGEALQPVKKKTRFVTEKGIREAGRESFGGEVATAAVNGLRDDDDDDDDDLEIVR